MTGQVSFDRHRLDQLLKAIERMASGELELELPISPAGDELDAIVLAVRVMAQELLYRLNQVSKAQSSLAQSGRLAALGEVSSGLAHELNNPLTVVLGHVERLTDAVRDRATTPLDFADVEDSLVKMERNVERMTSIIRHIMEFARQSRPVKRPVRLNEVIERSFLLMGEQLRLKRIKVDSELCPSNPVALGDALRLEQVFINLMTNARDAIIEARGESGGTIRIRSRVLSDSDLEVEVADDGIGMSVETTAKIFDPFFTTKEVGKGTGLGLSISHGIVSDHGGAISCISDVGHGAAFRIRLPRHHEVMA